MSKFDELYESLLTEAADYNLNPKEDFITPYTNTDGDKFIIRYHSEPYNPGWGKKPIKASWAFVIKRSDGKEEYVWAGMDQKNASNVRKAKGRAKKYGLVDMTPKPQKSISSRKNYIQSVNVDEDSGLVTAIVNPDYPKNWGVVIRQIISQVRDEMGSRYNYDYLVSDRDGNHIVDPHEKINGFVKALQRKYKDPPPKFDVNQFMRVGDDWDLQQTVQVIIKVK